MLLLCAALPPKVYAAELPEGAQEILQDSGVAQSDAGAWSFDGLLDKLGTLAAQSVGEPVRFAAKAIFYLLLACAVGLAAGGGGWHKCIDAISVLGFGAISLAAMMELVDLVNATAIESQTYLVAFVPVYSGVALLGGQTAGAAAYSGLFLTAAGFMSMGIQKLLLPVMGIYFCFAASAALWGNPGIEEAASLFSRCLSWLLKCCGALFSFVLGLQNILAGVADSAALKVGRSVLSGAVPVVGDAAVAALNSAAAAMQMLKGGLALAAVVALGASFLPVFLQCVLYYLAFSGAGIIAAGSGQKQCGQLCRLFADGAKLCGAILTLYFFLVILSTLLLLITGNGG